MVLHKNVNKFDIQTVLDDWWEDLAALGPKSVREYSIAFCDDAPTLITLLNSRLGEDRYQRRKHAGAKVDIETMVRQITSR